MDQIMAHIDSLTAIAWRDGFRIGCAIGCLVGVVAGMVIEWVRERPFE